MLLKTHKRSLWNGKHCPDVTSAWNSGVPEAFVHPVLGCNTSDGAAGVYQARRFLPVRVGVDRAPGRRRPSALPAGLQVLEDPGQGTLVLASPQVWTVGSQHITADRRLPLPLLNLTVPLVRDGGGVGCYFLSAGHLVVFLAVTRSGGNGGHSPRPPIVLWTQANLPPGSGPLPPWPSHSSPTGLSQSSHWEGAGPSPAAFITSQLRPLPSGAAQGPRALAHPPPGPALAPLVLCLPAAL